MHTCYADILALTPHEPHWFDEYAVPRFVDFEPIKIANIYAKETALVEIGCQACGRAFNVAFSSGSRTSDLLSVAITNNTLHYGDPPNIGCCLAGPTMNSERRRVIEYWSTLNPDAVDVDALRDRLASDRTTLLEHLSSGSEIAALAKPWAQVLAQNLAQAIVDLDSRTAPPPTQELRGWRRDRRLETLVYPQYWLDLFGSAWHLAPK